jgi:hypothetical protein
MTNPARIIQPTQSRGQRWKSSGRRHRRSFSCILTCTDSSDVQGNEDPSFIRPRKRDDQDPTEDIGDHPDGSDVSSVVGPFLERQGGRVDTIEPREGSVSRGSGGCHRAKVDLRDDLDHSGDTAE